MHVLDGKASVISLKKGAKRTPVQKICEAIDEAWIKLPPVPSKDHPPAAAKNTVSNDVVDGLFEPSLNLLTIEINKTRPECGKDDKSQAIKADKVSRLLAQPSILPPYYSGGLNLKNIKFEGAFALYNATVETPIAFTNAAFCGGEVKNEVIGLKNFWAGIYITGTTFKKRFLISGADIHHNITIVDSKFESTVAFNKVQAGIVEGSSSRMLVSNSTFKSRFLIVEGNFRIPVQFVFNKIKYFEIRGTDDDKAWFDDKVYIAANQFGDVQITSALFQGGSVISNNKVEQSFTFSDNWFLPSSSTKKSEIFHEIAGNEIDGFMAVAFDVANQDEFKNLELESNVVKGDVEIILPRKPSSTTACPNPWKGNVNLNNFQASSRLTIKYPDDVIPPSKLQDFQADPKCKEITVVNNEKAPALVVDFTGSNIRVLQWDLPLTRDFLWKGSGLRYQHWHQGKGDSNDLKWLVKWRGMMMEPELDGLNYISDYLWKRGSFVASRDILETAKELNYTPDKNDSWLEKVILGVIRILLWPGGYGARPEKAIFLLFWGWLGLGLWYRWHSCRSTTVAGTTDCPPGFQALDPDRSPEMFSVWRYSLDAMLPVINLHAYDRFVLKNEKLRWIPAVQHVCGWWWITVFLASAAIL